jgi:hypothetical protein
LFGNIGGYEGLVIWLDWGKNACRKLAKKNFEDVH